MTDDDLRVHLTDIQAATLTVYGEARNQPVIGLVAVLCVLANRLALKRWGTSWVDVCLAPWQFSCWNAADPNRAKLEALAVASAPVDDPVLDVCAFLAARVVAGDLRDPTGHATHYLNMETVKKLPTWTQVPAVRTTVIGNHSFFANVA